jgi:dephospho-CoA kinase
VVEPQQPAWHDISKIFGPDVFLNTGQLDRKQLGSLIFRDPQRRRILEEIIHPRVIVEIDRQESVIRRQAPEDVVIVDVPLLIEASMHTAYATIIVVFVSEALQVQRLMARDSFSEAEARQRIAAQMPLSAKCAYATHVIENDGGLEHTREQVRHIYASLCGGQRSSEK